KPKTKPQRGGVGRKHGQGGGGRVVPAEAQRVADEIGDAISAGFGVRSGYGGVVALGGQRELLIRPRGVGRGTVGGDEPFLVGAVAVFALFDARAIDGRGGGDFEGEAVVGRDDFVETGIGRLQQPALAGRVCRRPHGDVVAAEQGVAGDVEGLVGLQAADGVLVGALVGEHPLLVRAGTVGPLLELGTVGGGGVHHIGGLERVAVEEPVGAVGQQAGGGGHELDPVQIEIRREDFEAQHLLPGDKVHGFRNRGPALVAAGAGKGPYAGEVGAGHPDAHRAGGVGRGDAEVERVAAGVGDVGRVVEPLAGDHPAEIKTAAGVGGIFDVHALGGAVAVARVGGGVVVVGDALATGV